MCSERAEIVPTCGVVQILLKSLFVAGAVLCGGLEVWKCIFGGRRRES